MQRKGSGRLFNLVSWVDVEPQTRDHDCLYGNDNVLQVQVFRHEIVTTTIPVLIQIARRLKKANKIGRFTVFILD